MFKNDITGEPLVVSNKSTDVIKRALVAAHWKGAITAHEYGMTYAEVVEIGRLPQAFGGTKIPPHVLEEWTLAKSWE